MAYYPFIGGAEVAIAEIVRRLPQHQFDIVTVNLDGRQPKIEQIGNVTVHRLGGGTLSKYIFPLSAFIYSSRLQRQHCFDLVWSMMANQAGLAGLFFRLWFSQVRYVLTLQEGDSERAIWMRTWFMRPLYKMIYRRADAIQAISQYLADRARAMGYCGRIEVIGNGVPDNFFQHTTREVSDIKKTIVSVSRLVEKNGIEYLVRAMAHIDARLVLVGDGPLRSELERLVSELGMSEKVVFVGSVPYEQVPEYLATADVFVRPSLSEGLGSAFLEAMAMRVPVIATPVGGIVDFIVEGETGWLVNPKDVAQLAEKIEYVIDSNNQEAVNAVVERAYQLVAGQYRWNEVAQKMNVLFEQTVGVKKRIVIATGIYPPDIGGPATYSKLLYEQLPAYGVDVRVLSFGSVRCYPKIVRHLVYMWKLLWLSSCADLVYAQDSVSVGLPAAIVSKITRKKLLLKIVGDYAWEQGVQRFGVTDRLDDFAQKRSGYGWQISVLKGVERWVANQAQHIVVPSNYLQRIVSCWGVKTPVAVVYNAFDIRIPVVDRDVMRVSLRGSSALIVSVGRLVPWKGFPALVEAIGSVCRKYPDCVLMIIGDGPERERIEREIVKHELQDRVHLLGQMTHEQVLAHLAMADAFVLNTDYEGLSHQLLEAMALGVPIVTTPVGGNVELITDGVSGLLVSYNTVPELAAAIERYVSDPVFARNMARKSKEKVGEFSREKMMSSIVDIIEKV